MQVTQDVDKQDKVKKRVEEGERQHGKQEEWAKFPEF